MKESVKIMVLKHKNGTVDVGVRVEVRDEIMKELNEKLYEAKLVYYTPTFDDKVRVFCTNLPEKWQQSTTITDLQLSMVIL